MKPSQINIQELLKETNPYKKYSTQLKKTKKQSKNSPK
jgi:hypothetical protein